MPARTKRKVEEVVDDEVELLGEDKLEEEEEEIPSRVVAVQTDVEVMWAFLARARICMKFHEN